MIASDRTSSLRRSRGSSIARAWRTFRLVALLPFASLPACAKDKETTECIQARTRAREAALQGNLDSAADLLRTARQRCGSRSDHHLRAIDETIADKRELERQRQRQEAERQKEDEKRPAKRFVNWVIDKQNAVRQNLGQVRCAERGTPEFGFCEAQHPTSPEIILRYWEGQPSAFRYSLMSESVLSCQDLGDHRRVRTWSRGEDTYELCEPTEHALRSLSALVVLSPAQNQMFIFSHAYLKRDPAFERTVEGKRRIAE